MQNSTFLTLKGTVMKTLDPLDAVAQFVDAMNQGDLETALSFYEPQASFVVKPGVVVIGTIAIREALTEMVALKPTLSTEAQQVVEAGDIALYCSRWSLCGTDPVGNVVQMNGCSSDVLRRQPNGNWRIALDNPWGTEIIK